MSWYELFNETCWRRQAKGKIGPGVVDVKKGKGQPSASGSFHSPSAASLHFQTVPVDKTTKVQWQ